MTRSQSPSNRMEDGRNGTDGLPSQTNLEIGLDHKPSIEKALKLIFYDYIMILFPFIILGLVSGFFNWNNNLIFLFNFLAIIPLAKILGVVTEELSLHFGEAAGGLLNATFGNAIELIVTYFALTKNLVDVVQASLLGSILSNVLLVLGGAFVVSGYRHKVSKFNVLAAQTSASMLYMAVLSFVLPAAYSSSVNDPGDKKVVLFSRLISVVILIVYILFLFFQLKTHRRHFSGEYEEETDSLHILDAPNISRRYSMSLSQQPELTDEEIETPQIPVTFAVISLCLITILVSFCSEFLVNTLEPISENFGISKTFIGLILLPIVGNAAEHVTAITVAAKDKMDLSLSVAVGSSMQIALFVTPLSVIMGLFMNVDMSLHFNIFETTAIFVSTMIVNYIISDGRSNWLEGVMLLATYIIVAIASWLN